MSDSSKPPIGIMPMKIWQEITRIDELAKHIEDTKEYLRGLNTQ